MCGIAGLIGPPGDAALAARFAARLRHRGPDGAGTLVTERATLAQTRLALVDPRPHPLPLSDGRFTLLFNGEIYNHRELRKQLAGYPFTTETDTEVAFAALLTWGPAALTCFEGMFALFLWDDVTGDYLAAVDPLGVKPFVYHEGPGWFAFCSEAGPLLETGVVPFRPSEEGVAEHLTAPYFALSPFANLRRLPAGHHRTRHGTTAYRSATRNEDLLTALRRAVRTSTPAGLFLSGGVDSSLLAALAEPPLPAFTIDYGAMDYSDSLIVKSDDVPFSKQAAEAAGHPLTLVSPDDYEAALRRTLWANDHIAAWEQEVSQNLLAEAAAPHCKAVLVGDAADETHYGYGFLLDPARITSPRPLLDFFGAVPLRQMDGPAHFAAKYQAEAEAAGHRWTTPGGQLRAMSYLIRQRWLARLLHNGDVQLMAHSVEGRVPFADPTVLALADAAAPEEALGKRLLRRAAATVLPDEIAWRPKSALTKNLAGREAVHRLFRQAWQERAELLEPYVDADRVGAMGPPRDDRETGLQFRLLATLTWFTRWEGI
jgi:asparagine synthase (glutamine-hydrolysing)